MTRRLLAATSALVLTLAACGGSDDADDSADTADAPAEEPAPEPEPEPAPEPAEEPAEEPADEPEAAPADGATITIADFAFGEPITVAPGTEVTVTNADGAPHSVTADEAGFTSGILDPGTSGSFVAPDEPGTYTFFCAVHPSMTGQLIVG